MRHHYVPQFWMRRFADAAKQVYGREGTRIRVISTKDTMQMDGLYALFDSRWQPSEQLERALGEVESDAASLFDVLDDPTAVLTADAADHLAHFLALQACRHPDVLNRGHRAAKGMAELLADVQSYANVADFVGASGKFGIPSAEAAAYYELAQAHPASALLQEFDEVLTLSPQDTRLPATDALRALPLITQLFAPLHWTVLHAPTGMHFILGDTPLPQSELAKGFRVPLSKSTAVSASRGHSASRIVRRTATAAELETINREQWDNALNIVIGPNPAVLKTL